MNKKQKRQVAKISVFITSVFVIFLSVTYAFINLTITGTRRQVITAGNLDLILTEDANNLTITNALPMYDEVGMLQDAFTFRLVNRSDLNINYILRLVDVTTENKLSLTDVKYGLTKDGNHTIDLLSNLQENVVDSGTIAGNATIEYALRLWIRENLEDNALIQDKSLNYKIEIEATQNIDEVEENLTEAKDVFFANRYLDDTCTTYDDGVDTFLVGQCQNNYVWYSGKLWRVVLKNNETGAVKMVTDNGITVISYNMEYGVVGNDYVKQWLTQDFLPTLYHYENYLVTDSVWDSSADSSTTPSRPAGSSTISQTVGLLNAYEYYTTYAASNGKATAENGYLNRGIYWWLLTPSGMQNRAVNNAGALSTAAVTPPLSVRPSINLKANIQVLSGNGTITQPFRLEGEQEVAGGTTLLSTRTSGEFVQLNQELYRIVSVEN